MKFDSYGTKLACIEMKERSDWLSRIILASHGEMSKGLLNSITMIVGDELAKKIETVSLYPGESPNDIYREIEEKVQNSDEQFVIFCDVKGGSVHTTLTKLIVYPNVIVISGMNMNMVLDLVLSYQELTPETMEVFLESAKSGITLLSQVLVETEDEEF